MATNKGISGFESPYDKASDKAVSKTKKTSDSAKNTNTSSGMENPILGISPQGTTMRYVGENEKLLNSAANQRAILEHRQRNLGLVGRVGVTLNKKTGNVKVSAPEGILNSDVLKNNYYDALKSISQAYKTDHNQKFALLSNTDEKKTAEDWIKEIDESLKQDAFLIAQRELLRDEIKRTDGVDLDDENLTRMTTVALETKGDSGDKMKVSDSTLQVIPERLMVLPVFRRLRDAWEKSGAHTVQWGDLKEVWDRDKFSDDEFQKVFDAVEKYFSEGDFSDPREYAEMKALQTFMLGKDPSINGLRGAMNVTNNALKAAIVGAAQFDSNIFSAFETAINWVINMGQTIASVEQGADWDEAYREYQKDDTTWARDFLAPALEEWTDEKGKSLANLSDAESAAFRLVSSITPIAMQLATSVAAGNAAAAAAETAIGRLTASVALKYGETAQTLSTITLSNAIAEGVNAEKLAKGLYTGTEIMLKLAEPAVAANIAIDAIKTVKTVSYAAGAAVKMADIAAQVVVDVTLSDPKLFRQLLESDNADAKSYAMEQLAANAVGEVAAVGIGKAVKGFSKTDVGRVLNATATTRLNAVKASVGETADKIKTFLFHGGDEGWIVEKVAKRSQQADKLAGTWLGRIASNRASRAERQFVNYAERAVLRRAARNIGDLASEIRGNTWDEIVDSAKAVQREARAIASKANVDVVQAMYKQDVSAEVEQIIKDDSVLESMRAGYVDKLTAVIKAEDAEGLGKGLRRTKVATPNETTKITGKMDTEVVRVLSKETNEYVEALYRVRIAEAQVALGDIAEKVKGAQDELPHLYAIIENFEDSHSVELVNAAKALDRQAVKFSEALQNARVRLGVMAQDTLDGIRASGFFDEGYRRQQRIKNWAKYKQNGGQLHVRDLAEIQHIDWGNTVDEWQDVSIVMFDDLNELGRQVVRKRATDALEYLGFKSTVAVSADGSRVIEEVDPIRKQVVAKIDEHAKKYVSRMDDSFFNDFFDLRMKKQTIKNAQADAITSGGKVAKSKAYEPTSSMADRQKLIRSLDAEELDRCLELVDDNPFRFDPQDPMTWGEEEFRDFEERLGKTSRDYLHSKMDEQVGYLYDTPATPKDIAKAQIKEIQEKGGYSAASWKAATGKDKVPRWANPIISERGGAALQDLTEIDELKKLVSASRGAAQKLDVYTGENFQRLIENDPDFLDELKRFYATGNSEIYNHAEIKRVTGELNHQKRVYDAQNIYRNNVRRLQTLSDKYNLPAVEQDVLEAADELIETAIDDNYANEKIMRAMRGLGDATAGGDDLVEYATLKSLKDNQRTIKANFNKKAQKSFNEQMTAQINLKYANDPKGKAKASQAVNKEAKKYADEATKLFSERINQRYDEVVGRLAAQGSDIIDKRDYFAKVSELNRQITDAAANPNVVKTYGAYGYEEYIEYSPTIAGMFNIQPRPLKRGPFGTIQNAFVRTFRIGTTGGFVPGSLVNQAFRDTGNAIIAGDAWKTNATVKRLLSEEFGETVAEYMQKEMPDVYDTLLTRADETGKSFGEAFAESEFARGRANVSAELESNLYQLGRENRIKRSAEGVYERNVWDKITDWLDEAQRKADTLNNIRETYLRQRVYSNNLLEGLDTGMSLPEARTFATFMQQEATTNFMRQSYHLANLTQTVPYLGAAINGAKSFWRLYALDPVGITTRIIGGFVVPMIHLTAMSLANEENRKVYEKIPEYEKEEHITFVAEGQIFTIPIPQEIGGLVTPIQHMVEKMYDANDNSFAELMANDLLGAFPVNLNGFVNIDADRILEENLVEDHLVPGFSKASSSLMPPLVKSGFMLLTGIDPYTNKKIDTSWRNFDYETGESVVYDYTSGFLAKAIGNTVGDLMSAQMAQKVLSNLFGTGGMAVADALGDVLEAVTDEDEETTFRTGLQEGGSRLIKNATDKLTSEIYDEESNLAWNRAVRVLEAEKDAMLNDKAYQEDLAALSSEKLSEEARAKVESRLRTRQQEYYNKVLNATNNLINEYDGTFDRYKMLTVISLMNLDKDEINANPYNVYSTSLSAEELDLNKAIAVETMVKMGFSSTNDQSLFGYYAKNADGTVTIKYNSPLAILNYNRSSWQQHNIEQAEIEAALEEAGITRKKMFGDEQKKAQAAGKKAYKQYKANWNKQVVKVLYPYIKERGVQAFMNSNANRELLEQYIFIDNKYKMKEYLLELFGEKSK